MMHKIIKLLKGKQSGQALILALILLAVGSLILVPLLGLMGDGLIAGVIVEDKTDELYACDAGVQDAIWKINNRDQVPGFPESWDANPNYIEYSLPDVNGNLVTINLEYINPDNGGTFRVRSWVGGTITENDTMIDAIITTMWVDYYDFLDHVITSGGDIDLNPPGGPSSPDINPDDPDHPNGPRDYHPEECWPTAEELISWYMRDVDDLDPYLYDTIDVKDLPLLPPPYAPGRTLESIYREGYLQIQSSTQGLVMYIGNPAIPYDPDNPEETLNTIYVAGDLDIKSSKEFTIKLNNQTIFVEGDIYVDPKVSLGGNGCIIAVGDIVFQPQMASDPGEFIFVMSIEGTVSFQPQGDFYGAIAGIVEVQMQPNSSINWTGPPPGLNFPIEGAGGSGMLWGIHTWKIN